ncbi:MAG: error-prone DNA polymerase [Acidimicrobiales bacterium]
MTDPPYAELHCHSNFSFLDGSSSPEELVAEAARLGLSALAITDHDGLYAAVRLAAAAERVGLPTVFGAELTLGLKKRQQGMADPEGEHLVVLARDQEGYARLARAISAGQLAGSAGCPAFDLATLAQAHNGHWLVTTACRKGAVPAALMAGGPSAAGRALDRLVEAFGRGNVVVELWHHDDPLDDVRNDALVSLAVGRGVDLIATSAAHYATPAGHRLATAVAAVRARRSLDDLDPWLPRGPGAHLRSGREQARRFRRWPGVVERTGELGRSLAFDLALLAPGLPPFPVPRPFPSEAAYLRHLVAEGAAPRYGPRHAERAPGAWAQLDHELAVIEALGYPGYFLVVWDVVRFCREHGIYVQGRGSAANSAVCYALGITAVDAVRMDMLFERFLSVARRGAPDIDLDIESGRREEALQYVFARYGRDCGAQVANVVTYRPRLALRDAARALGYPQGTVDAWSRRIERRAHVEGLATERDADGAPVHDIPGQVLALAAELEDAPRHLGLHPGGMVVTDRPIVEICPVEWATMQGRTRLQWDKEDCARIGLTKIDFLGLGMLSALHRTVDALAAYDGTVVDPAALPYDDETVWDLLCAADTVGVFQVESRAQMQVLPRMRPRCLYDLAVEIALVRPGPIQGGAVHPYLRRRCGEEPVTYLHPLLEEPLAKTLGVPLFQEQLMTISQRVAGFSGAEADELREAMGSRRSAERMEALRVRFYAGMAEREITGAVADAIWESMAAFAHFGFPESHALSFAFIAYASAWLKVHHPAAFLAGLLIAQPMGFWSPRTLVADAQRHGVVIRRAEVNRSAVDACLEQGDDPTRPAVRLGLGAIRTIGTDAAEQLAAGQPYRDLADLARRSGLDQAQLEALATAGATADLDGGDRRAALWAAGALAERGAPRLLGISVGVEAPGLPAMTEADTVAADLWATGVTTGTSLTELARPLLDERGVTLAADLATIPDGKRVVVAGVVTHRQRPETARGITFVSLEDESGLVNVICSVGVWTRYRRVAQGTAAMIVRGRVESARGVVNVVAERIEALELAATTRARNFR